MRVFGGFCVDINWRKKIALLNVLCTCTFEFWSFSRLGKNVAYYEKESLSQGCSQACIMKVHQPI